jgi:glutaredoxin 3
MTPYGRASDLASPDFGDLPPELGLVRVSRSPHHSPFEKAPNLSHCMGVKPKRIRLFVKPYCGWCHKAERWLDDRGINYKRIDVISDETAYDEMIRLSGQDLAPVLDVDGKILADFGPDQLARFWKTLEK